MLAFVSEQVPEPLFAAVALALVQARQKDLGVVAQAVVGQALAPPLEPVLVALAVEVLVALVVLVA